MGKIVPAQPVTPFLGILFHEAPVVDAALIWIEHLMGKIALESETWEFTDTDHYDQEMGRGLKRRFLVFRPLADPTLLPDWKIATNALEGQLADQFSHKRPINLDPGYITGAKLVLASVKGLGHRVYLRNGIYAEATLSYAGGEWIKRDYTFPDFSSGQYDEFLSRAREYHLDRTRSQERA